MAVHITSITPLEILDSQGNPTVEVEVGLSDGSVGVSSVPVGIAPGEFEAVELRDGDRGRFLGKGVMCAIDNIDKIILPALINLEIENHELVDKILIELDGTYNKSNLGVNAVLGVSTAVAKAVAHSKRLDLFEYLKSDDIAPAIPTPIITLISGGILADSGLDVQGIMIVPNPADCGSCRFGESVRMASEIFGFLGMLLQEDGYGTGVSCVGGYVPRIESTELAFDFILKAINKAGYTAGEDVSLAIDVAASELLAPVGENETILYHLSNSSRDIVSAEELILLYERWCKNYPIISIEDGLGDEDWNGWRELTSRLGSASRQDGVSHTGGASPIQIVGDDLFATNLDRLQVGIDRKVANTVSAKLSHVGTLLEVFRFLNLAKKNNYRTLLAGRSAETCDTILADICVAAAVDQVRFGAICRGENAAKFNRLLKLEKKL